MLSIYTQRAISFDNNTDRAKTITQQINNRLNGSAGKELWFLGILTEIMADGIHIRWLWWLNTSQYIYELWVRRRRQCRYDYLLIRIMQQPKLQSVQGGYHQYVDHFSWQSLREYGYLCMCFYYMCISLA